MKYFLLMLFGLHTHPLYSTSKWNRSIIGTWLFYNETFSVWDDTDNKNSWINIAVTLLYVDGKSLRELSVRSFPFFPYELYLYTIVT